MLTVALVSSSVLAAEAIAQLLEDTGLFRLVYRASKVPDAHLLIRAVHANDPDLLLVDVTDWHTVAAVLGDMGRRGARTVPIGYRRDWTMGEEAEMRRGGLQELLREPFSPRELEQAAYEALHRARPIHNGNILAFLPAKAGGGSSTVAIHTAEVMARQYARRVLLMECDRRSGVYSILINRDTPRGFTGAVEDASELTELSWRNYTETALGMDLLLATPHRRGALPTWGDYYQLLQFVQDRYEFLVADLPEVVNSATAELVRHARGVFLVCTPELPSIKMAAYRCRELEECEVPADRVHVVLNRFERGGLTAQDAEAALGRPVFTTLPNDYGRIRHAMLESRLVAPDSPFGRGCQSLAEKIGGVAGQAHRPSRFSILQKLGRMMQ